MHKMKVNTWQFMYPTKTGGMYYVHFAVDPDTCLPVLETAAGEENGVSTSATSFYANVKPTIEDRTSLSPPIVIE
nr:hypothetical protein BaRGS_000131 [Batillaria attramentaria]